MFSLPAIAAGVAVGSLGLTRTAEIYSAAVIVLALSAATALALRRPTADLDERQPCESADALAA
jgi:hypothetical protein